MHILRGVLIADIKREGAQAFENANGYLGWISTLQQTLLRANTHCNSGNASSAAKPIVPTHWRMYILVAKTYECQWENWQGEVLMPQGFGRGWKEDINVEGLVGGGLALKPGKTSVANQAWTCRATRRQQIMAKIWSTIGEPVPD